MLEDLFKMVKDRFNEEQKDRRASLGRLLKLQWSKIYLLSTRFGLKLRRQIS